MHLLQPRDPIENDHRVIRSAPHFEGCYMYLRYRAEPVPGESVPDVVAAPDAARWTVPPVEWDSLWRAEFLPDEWRDPAARPPTPDARPLVAALRCGFRERLDWWADTRYVALVGVRVMITEMQVHPTDTTPGVCAIAGRDIADDLVRALLGAGAGQALG